MNNLTEGDIVETKIDRIVHGEVWAKGTWCNVLEVLGNKAMVIPVLSDVDYMEYFKFNELDLVEEEII
jgi:hypothetical protein